MFLEPISMIVLALFQTTKQWRILLYWIFI